MNTLSDINFNYDRAIRQAERLEVLSRRLKKAANEDMERILSAVNRAWKSASAPNYLRKGETVEADLAAMAEDLKKTALKIRTIAEQVREADMEARRIADEH